MEVPRLRAAQTIALPAACYTLPPDFRIVFVLREVEGCAVEETARQLGLNPQTVKSRLFRARLAIRRELEKSLADGIEGVFPFLGKRCEGLMERLVTVSRPFLT